MKNFKTYIEDWFHSWLEEHEEQDDFFQEVFYAMGYTLEELGEDNHLDFLLDLSADDIYDKLLTIHKIVDDQPDLLKFLVEMFKQAVPDKEKEFVDEFVEDMAEHSESYNSPLGFFQDLTHGCQSGLIGMLIYNSDCQKIYGKYANDMETFKEEIEQELGVPIHNKSGVPHYTFVCWFCYEELGFQIARNLFEDEF